MIFAIVNLSTGLVENVIVADSGFVAPDGFQAVASTTAAIGDTYSNGTFTPPAPTQAQLVAYANGKQQALMTGGYTITLPEGTITFATDISSMSLITGKAVRLQQANAPASVDWQTGPTTFTTIVAADFITAATDIADFVQATFDALQPIFSGIAAGTITATAQIDAATWPASSA